MRKHNFLTILVAVALYWGLCASAVSAQGIIGNLLKIEGDLLVGHSYAAPGNEHAHSHVYQVVEKGILNLGSRITTIQNMEQFYPAHLLSTGMKVSVRGTLLDRALSGVASLVATNITVLLDSLPSKRAVEDVSSTVTARPLVVFLTTLDAVPIMNEAEFDYFYTSGPNNFRHKIIKITNNRFSFAQPGAGYEKRHVKIDANLYSCGGQGGMERLLDKIYYNLRNGVGVQRTDPRSFSTVSIVTGDFSPCGFCGYAIVNCFYNQYGGDACWSFMGCKPNFAGILTHELLHSIGLGHSNQNYGDVSCIMGGARDNGLPNFMHRVKRGWLQGTVGIAQMGDYLYDITDVYNPTPNKNVGFKIPFGSGDNDAYYLSWRFQNSQDTDLNPEAHNKLFVHMSYVASDPSKLTTSLIATLSVGQTFVPRNGITVRFRSADMSSRVAIFQVTKSV